MGSDESPLPSCARRGRWLESGDRQRWDGTRKQTDSVHPEPSRPKYRRRRALRSTITAALLGAGLVAGSALDLGGASVAPAALKPTIIIYGDSLADQVRPDFNFYVGLSGANVVDHIFPGTAPCDWTQQMQTDAATHPAAVVMEFSGNPFGCMSYPPGTAIYYTQYEQQVTQEAQMFTAAGSHVFLIGTPMNYRQVTSGDRSWDHLVEIYAQIAASNPGVTFVNAAASIELNGAFAWEMPCLSFETGPDCGPGRLNIVRQSDGFHLCPLQDAHDQCLVYASGEVRYGLAMAAPVDDFLKSGTAPAYEGPALPPPDTAPTLAPNQVDPYRLAPVPSHAVAIASVPSGAGYWTSDSSGNASAYSFAPWSPPPKALRKPVVGLASTPDGHGYWLVGSDGGVFSFGDARFYGSTGGIRLNRPVVGMATTADGRGYWLVASDGGVFSFGDARFYGSTGGITLNRPVVGMAGTADGRGYWLVAGDGGIFSFGNARFHGVGISSSPMVGMAADRETGGYWEVASNGRVFAFGSPSLPTPHW
jgi:hypothetical protein